MPVETLDTNTYVFPLEIKDVANDICVGFVLDLNKVRSLRKTKNLTKEKNEKKVKANFARANDSTIYTEQVYVSNVKGTYSKNEQLLDEPIMLRFWKY